LGFLFSVIARLFVLLGLLTGLVVVAVIVIALLAVVGSAKIESCPIADGSAIAINHSDALAAEFDAKWLLFQSELLQGKSALVSFSQDQVSSRASNYFAAKTDAIKDVSVCFQPDQAEASASFKILGVNISARMKGSVDFNGEQPKVHITSLKVGALPTGPLRQLIAGLINDQLADLPVDYPYQVAFQENSAAVSVQR
jgi:hypothetical protein